MYSNPIMFHNGPVNNTWHYLFNNDTVDLLKILNKNFKCRLILNVKCQILPQSFMTHNLTSIFWRKSKCISLIVRAWLFSFIGGDTGTATIIFVRGCWRLSRGVTWLWRDCDAVTVTAWQRRAAIRHNQEEFLRSIK